MNAITYDTLSISKRLKAGGFSEPQAEAIAREIQEAAVEDHLVTKDFLREQMINLEEKLNLRMDKTELRIVLKIGSMIFMLGGLLVAIKYFG